jgi:hypothetical protein
MINKNINMCWCLLKWGVFLAQSYQGDRTVTYSVMRQVCHSHSSVMHK